MGTKNRSGLVIDQSEKKTPRRGMLRRPDAAAYMGTTANFLAKAAVTGTGPAYHKLGTRTVLYDMADLDAWLVEHRVMSTSELS